MARDRRLDGRRAAVMEEALAVVEAPPRRGPDEPGPRHRVTIVADEVACADVVEQEVGARTEHHVSGNAVTRVRRRHVVAQEVATSAADPVEYRASLEVDVRIDRKTGRGS